MVSIGTALYRPFIEYSQKYDTGITLISSRYHLDDVALKDLLDRADRAKALELIFLPNILVQKVVWKDGSHFWRFLHFYSTSKNDAEN
jgi:hypothetical protein